MKTVVITGATSGIGFAVAQRLASQGMHVIGVGRTQEHCEEARLKICRDNPEADVVYFCGDLAQQSEVRAVALRIQEHLSECGDELDALILNAGGVRNGYTTTAEGYELQFALNHLSGFLLTALLLPQLQRSGGRVVLTGSNSHKHAKVHWKDVMYKRHYSCLMAYKQSKLCNLLFAAELNRRFSPGIRAYVADPGLVHTDIGIKQTSGLVRAFWAWRCQRGVSPDFVAQTYAMLVSQMPAPPSLYYHACREQRYDRRVDSIEDAARLFELSNRLCGNCFEGGKRK